MDTDAARDSEESYTQLLDAMRWLGFDWDEGPEVGGPHAPYRQSQRIDLYPRGRGQAGGGPRLPLLLRAEELEDAREAARKAGRPSGYDGTCRTLTAEQIAGSEAEGRVSIVRFRMPDEPITFTDLVRGELTLAERLDCIVRANGAPLHARQPRGRRADGDHACAARRGPALLHPTADRALPGARRDRCGPRHGVPAGDFGHLPYVMGEGNKKLSKRDPQSSLNLYRERGFLPEGLLNYLSLLGWSLSSDRDVFSLAEMVEAFDISGVNANPARFDLKKAEAINADHIRLLDVKAFIEACEPWLKAPHTPSCSDAFDAAAFAALAPLAQTRLTVLSDITANVDFLFLDEPAQDEASWTKAMKPGADALLASVRTRLAEADWDAETLKAAVLAAGEEHGLLQTGQGPGPLRVAVAGGTVGLPLFESLEVLGRERTLARVDAALAKLAG
ncbi:Glutamate--tRNA ligase OS=Streptomyces antimycoticus OX=68175 GN=gltX PE=3 SV=1 [Streptomyces antimycoticus]